MLKKVLWFSLTLLTLAALLIPAVLTVTAAEPAPSGTPRTPTEAQNPPAPASSPFGVTYTPNGFPILGDAATPQGEDMLVVTARFSARYQVDAVAAWTEPWDVDYKNGVMTLGIRRDQIQQLETLGLTVWIDEAQTALMNTPRLRDPNQPNGIPGYACYRTVEETYATAQQIVAQHPTLAQWIDIGNSWEKTNNPLLGYDLMVLKLTNQAIVDPEKPKLFIMASIHAREYTPAELVTRFAEYLINNYNTDPDVTWLLDYTEIHLLLQANPDGRKQAETGLSWRKNTNQNYCATDPSSRGADLNRNFSFYWGCCGGSSGTPCSETYRGPSAASEPETQAVQNYVRSIFPDQRGPALTDPAPANATGVFLDVHSFSQLVLWPWGFSSATAPNGTALQTLGRKFAYYNNYTPQQAIELYPTDGTTDDFAYGDLGIAAYTFELGTSFFEGCSTFENTIVPQNLPALIYAAKASRTPYQTPAGPDALNVTIVGGAIAPGQPANLTATLNDTRFNNGQGTEPTQNIAAAEYYIDTPPWADGATAYPMAAADGSFNSSIENVTGSIDTTGLSAGRHMIYVRGRDAANNWGAVTAQFLYIIDPAVSPSIQGRVRAADTGLPLAATVSAGSIFSADTNPNGQYEMHVVSGTYTLVATPADDNYSPASVEINAPDYSQITQNFWLMPYCTAFSDDVEGGNIGWTAQTPWGIVTNKSHSPTHAWTDSPSGNYGNYLNTSLTSPVINLSGYTDVTLDFWQICDTEAGWDYCHVEYSTNGGTSWTEVATYDGNHSTWEQKTIALPALDNKANARIRFRLTSDSNTVDDGWYLDDIRIRGSGTACLNLTEPTASFESSSPDLLGTTTVFTDTSTGGMLNFVWDFGDGSPLASEIDPTHQYAGAGEYTVTLLVTNTLGSSTFTDTVRIEYLAPTLQAEKVASAASALPGEVVTYTLNITLTDASQPLFSQWLTDTLPAELQIITQSITLNGTPFPTMYHPSGHILQLFSEGGLTNGQFHLEIIYAAQVITSTPPGVITNTLSVRSTSGEAVLRANTSVPLSIGDLPDLTHSKTVSAPQAYIGDTLTYTLQARLDYLGTHTATLSMTDTLPSGLEILTDSLTLNGAPMPGLYNPQSQTIHLAESITFTDSVTVTVVYRVRVSGEFVNMPLYTAASMDGTMPMPQPAPAYAPVEVVWHKVYLPMLLR
ncbi:MAG: hypothetical protein OHK0052_14900 [Anaerolineales bacterium]